MPRFRLRILRRPGAHGGVDTHSEWLTADTLEEAVTQAEARADQLLAGEAGVGLLSDEHEAVVWSHRYDLPKPDGLG